MNGDQMDKRWKQTKEFDKDLWLRRLVLILYDILAVIVSSYFALFLRFDFSFGDIPENYEQVVTIALPFSILLTLIVFMVFRLYSSLWTYAGAMELTYIVGAGGTSGFLNMFLILTINMKTHIPLPRAYYVYYTINLIVLVFISRYAYRALRSFLHKRIGDAEKKRILIIGAGSAGDSLIREITRSSYLNMKVVGVIDDNSSKVGNYIHGVRILGNRNSIAKYAEKLRVDEIIIAMPSVPMKEIKEILNICKETGCELKRLPGMYQLVNGEVSVAKIRDVDVNDLLGREPIQVNLDSIMKYVSNRVIMVTGAGGSIGSELCRQIAKHQPRQLVMIDIYENTTYDIQNELKKNFPELNLVVLIASVRNTKRMDDIFNQYRPEIVYHAAAHKHVPLMEDSPNEAVKNNVLGTWKVVQAADKWQVKRFVMISTDKAVNPTNIMGATKRICEMLIQTYDKHSKTEFVAVRFGNVLGSNGSVIPLFQKQIAAGGPVTVTHPDIIRYFMTIPEAVSLVLQAGAYAKGGEIFVLDMGEPVKIVDLARNLILLSGHKPDEEIPITFTGLRPGEKLYEEMLMQEEGMQDTENRLIHIGKPIEMDEERFMELLQDLSEYVVEEPEDIREKVAEIVPTYQYKA